MSQLSRPNNIGVKNLTMLSQKNISLNTIMCPICVIHLIYREKSPLSVRCGFMTLEFTRNRMYLYNIN